MRNKILIIAIIFLGIFLRFYKLGEIPHGLYQDETAIGWNAYSLLQTGKDEHGNSFPIYFKSFGDYKLPVYIYSTAISVTLFGLTPFAVRFPSALFGVLTLPIFYLLVKRLTKNEPLAVISMFLLTINPWHLHYTRATFEVSIVLFLFALGILLFHEATNKKRGAFIGSIVCFILALYSYNLTRLLSPLIVLGLLLLYRKNLYNISLYEKVSGCITGILLLIPFILTYANGGGISSASGTLIFSSAAVQAPLLEFRSYFVHMPLVNKLIFNSVTLTTWQYLMNVASYFSVPFFFLTGSQHGNHGIGTHGQFYIFELPFILVGIYYLFKEKEKKLWPLLFVGVMSILVAALTREAPHATRSFALLLFLPVISAYGFIHILRYSMKLPVHIKYTSSIVFCSVMLFCLCHYFLSYFVRFPIAYAKAWREEDSSVVKYIQDNWEKYDRIIIDKDSGLIYSSILFYQSFSPNEFQDTIIRAPDDNEGMSDVLSFGKIVYKKVSLENDIREPRTLIIMNSEKNSSGISPDVTFLLPSRPVVIAVKQNLLNYPTQETAYVAFFSKE